MRTIAILNPAADHGRLGKKRPAVEAALRQAGLAGEVWLTRGPHHAVELAQRAAAEADVVVAVGGDGTVHEVCRGLLASRQQAHLGVLPLGTGNDFAWALGMDRRLEVAARQLGTATPTAIDYGVVRWQEDETHGEQPFVNTLGIGLDARVSIEVDALKFLPGPSGYMVAVLRSLLQRKETQARITGIPAPNEEAMVLYEGDVLIATAGNGIRSGGAFYLTPRASFTDGLLDICVAENPTFLRVLQLLLLVLRGKHEDEPEIKMFRIPALTLTTSTGMPVHADGEILAIQAHWVDVTVVPGGLSVMKPA